MLIAAVVIGGGIAYAEANKGNGRSYLSNFAIGAGAIGLGIATAGVVTAAATPVLAALGASVGITSAIGSTTLGALVYGAFTTVATFGAGAAGGWSGNVVSNWVRGDDLNQNGKLAAILGGIGNLVANANKIVQAFKRTTAVNTRADLATHGLAKNSNTRGGVDPVNKGKAGVEKSIQNMPNDEVLVGREVTFETGKGTVRVDYLTKTEEGLYVCVECKTGQYARLNVNQKTVFPEIEQGGAIPRGNNASKAGLTPGVKVGPMKVRVDKNDG